MNHIILVIYLSTLLFSIQTFASRNLAQSANLHPLDTFTPDTFKAGEWSYSQPPIFAPGYSFYGVTDELTIQLDYTAWLGGVASLNARYRLTQNNSFFNLAVEAMALYIPDTIDELDKDNENLYTKREGAGGYVRLNSSFKINKSIELYLSFGSSYSEYLKISNENRPTSISKTFNELSDPIWMIGAKWTISPTLLFITNASYGETWGYFENRPRKQQFIYGFRWAPFVNSQKSTWNNLSIDLAAIFARFDDADEEVALPIPIFPILTWQWN